MQKKALLKKKKLHQGRRPFPWDRETEAKRKTRMGGEKATAGTKSFLFLRRRGVPTEFNHSSNGMKNVDRSHRKIYAKEGKRAVFLFSQMR